VLRSGCPGAGWGRIEVIILLPLPLSPDRAAQFIGKMLPRAIGEAPTAVQSSESERVGKVGKAGRSIYVCYESQKGEWRVY